MKTLSLILLLAIAASAGIHYTVQDGDTAVPIYQDMPWGDYPSIQDDSYFDSLWGLAYPDSIKFTPASGKVGDIIAVEVWNGFFTATGDSISIGGVKMQVVPDSASGGHFTLAAGIAAGTYTGGTAPTVTTSNAGDVLQGGSFTVTAATNKRRRGFGTFFLSPLGW